MRVLSVLVCLLTPNLLASAPQYVTHVIKDGETVSQIVFGLTGSCNYRSAGIEVAIIEKGHDTHRIVPKEPRSNFDNVLPGWEVRINKDLVPPHPPPEYPNPRWLLLGIPLAIVLYISWRRKRARKRTLQARMKSYFEKFKTEWELPHHLEGHKFQWELRCKPSDGRFEIFVTPLNCLFPNMGAHRDNTMRRLEVIQGKLVSEPFRVASEPWMEGRTLCVSFVFNEDFAKAA